MAPLSQRKPAPAAPPPPRRIAVPPPANDNLAGARAAVFAGAAIALAVLAYALFRVFA